MVVISRVGEMLCAAVASRPSAVGGCCLACMEDRLEKWIWCNIVVGRVF
jgi:hypothetical protein